MASRHQLHREYLAIVQGNVKPAEGTVDAPIGRRAGSIMERTIGWNHGEHAVTHYRVLQSSQTHSLISLKLETGRTHQIRVHMKYLGFPLIGDYLYNPDFSLINRQALHSCHLSFLHPMTGKPMEFNADLPEDMRAVVDSFF